MLRWARAMCVAKFSTFWHNLRNDRIAPRGKDPPGGRPRRGGKTLMDRRTPRERYVWWCALLFCILVAGLFAAVESGKA